MSGKLIKTDFSLADFNDGKIVRDLVSLNPFTRNHGLIITEEAARYIMSARKEALRYNGRVEFKSDAILRLVRAFSASPYIFQNNFHESIGEIIDLFYYIKNETENRISDDDLISELLEIFNGTCQGEIELLQSKGLEKIVRRFRMGDEEIWEDYGDGEEDYDYEEDWRE